MTTSHASRFWHWGSAWPPIVVLLGLIFIVAGCSSNDDEEDNQRAPVAVDDTATTTAGTPVTIQVLANDTDANNDPLTVTNVTPAASGAVVIADDTTVTYTPNANFVGIDTFTYTIRDDQAGGTATATVVVTVTLGDNVQLTGIVDDGTATSPVPNALCRFITLDGEASPSTTANGQGRYNLVIAPELQGFVVCTPPNLPGLMLRTYVSTFGIAAGTVITSEDVRPGTSAISFLLDDARVADPNTDLAALANNLSDRLTQDPPDPAIAVLADSATILFNALLDNNLNTNFTTALDDLFSDSTLNDANLAAVADNVNTAVDTAETNRGVQVMNAYGQNSPRNLAPVAVNDTSTTDENTASAPIAVLANDSDADGDALSITAVTNGTSGTTALSGTTIVYTPNAGFFGSDSFTYTISDGTATATATVTVTVVAAPQPLRLTVLHNNDGESQLLNAGGGELENFGGIARFASVVQRLRTEAAADNSAVVLLSSGDNYLAGPEFNASLSRQGEDRIPFFDTIALDRIGYTAFAIGNHEFDFGPDVLAEFVQGFTSSVPFVSANLNFTNEANLQALVEAGRIVPSTVITVDGRQIGIVGATTPLLPFISSPRNVTVNADVAGVVQAEVDRLTAEGVRMIILISHLQSITEDLDLIPQLRNVDIAIAGGGDDLLANAGDVLLPGDTANPERPYPLLVQDDDGVAIPVITTSGDYRYVGRLIVDIDADGAIINIDPASGPVRVAGGDNPDAVVPDAVIQEQVVEPVQAAIAQQAATIIGVSEVPLNGVRNDVRTLETNEGNLLADALLSQATRLAPAFDAPAPDIALQNGGGIRNNAVIPVGNISELNTFDIAPFANFVSIVPNSAPAQLKEILENAVSRVESIDGRFAQIAGFRFTWDPNGTPQSLDDAGTITTPGTRVREVVLDDGRMIVQNGELVAGAPGVGIATNDFSARGGDQYPFRGAPFITLGITYQQALATHIQETLTGVISAAQYPVGGEGRIIRGPQIARDANPQVLGVVNGVTLFNGGFGSSIASVPGVANDFYLLTDRGPNVDGPEANTLVFPFPAFAPQIARFRVNGSMLERVGEVIELRNADGVPLSGLPNPPGEGGTNEIPLGPDLNRLDDDPEGVDSEGLVALADGTFWVSDEYGPHILHLEADGTTIERINPFGTGTGGRTIPAVLATRRPNRGMEGLTITPDGTTLVGIMQSPLDNPNTSIRSTSRITRLLTFNIATGMTQQFIYLLNDPSLVNSAIHALSNTSFLVLERDGSFPGDPEATTPAFKRVYSINISNATNVSDPANGANGLLLNGRTLEQICLDVPSCEDGLAAANMVPVSKTLVVDLLTLPILYPHDKAEGVTVVDDRTLAIANDDDFGVVADGGQLVAKILPATGEVDHNEIWLVRTPAPFMPAAPVRATGIVDSSITTASAPLAGAVCRFVSLGNATLAQGTADANGVYMLDIAPNVEGFVECWPAGLGNVRLRRFVSTVSVASGATLSEQNLSPATTVVDSILSTTLAGNPETDRRALQAELLQSLSDGNNNLGILADAASLLFNAMLNAGINVDFAVALNDLGTDGALDLPDLQPIAATVATALAEAEAVHGITVEAAFTTLSPTVRIHTIQGSAQRSPLEGQQVRDVYGVVTAVAARGFYFQDSLPDTNEATSEGLFVFTSSAPGVSVGDEVLVAGLVTEFRPSASTAPGNLTTTELTTPTVTVLSSGNPLPEAVVIGLDGRIPPAEIIADDVNGDAELVGDFDPQNDGLDFYESLEGMRVQVNNAVAVSPTTSFGEIALVGDNATRAGLLSPRGALVIRPDDFNPERILIDDTLVANPTQVNVGDRFEGPVVGVLDYTFGNFKLFNTAALPGIIPGDLQAEVSTLTGSPNQLTVATFNVENLDNNPDDDDNTSVDAARFAGLASIIVNNLGTPDIIALQEVQDSSGSTDDAVVDGIATYTALIAAIDAAGGPTYDFREIAPENNTNGGQPGGNIRVGYLFNPARVTFVDRGTATATDATAVVAGENGPELTLSPGLIDPSNAAFVDSRKPLAAEFRFERQRLFLINNHFASKTGSDPLVGRFQPPANGGEAQRVMQAQVVRNFVSDILAIDATAQVIVLGDLNEFQFLPPIQTLTGGNPPVLTNLTETLPEAERYTFIFDGNAESLDHILVSSSLQGLAEIDIVHANAEFASSLQSSDHDPNLARFTFPVRFATFNASLNRNTLGQLLTDVSTPGNPQAQVIAEIIQRSTPDVVLLNEFDVDPDADADPDESGDTPLGTTARLFAENYLEVSQNGATPVRYPYVFVTVSNTGLPCPPAVTCDLDNNGVANPPLGDPNYGNDALGFGTFPGQFGMVLYSKFPIDMATARTFRNFLWRDMPGAALPDDANTPELADWYSEEELRVFPLSSKSHWDVPIMINGQTVHVLASHPTPPVFDGEEDRNGRRNHDEIRLWADYITGAATYLIDDNDVAGPLGAGESFVILGDQNADPFDGDSFEAAILQLLDLADPAMTDPPLINPEINNSFAPASPGAVEQAGLQGGANATHLGDPAFDTADFADTTPGNLRADYVLPSANLTITDSAVFWPVSAEVRFPLVGTFPFPSSDHRLVWVDVVVPR